MDKASKIYIAGHRGLVGSALVRNLEARGYNNLLLRSHAELELTDQESVRSLFEHEKPEYIFLAAAMVGGVLANNTYPADFIHSNLAIQSNIIHEAFCCGVTRLLFLGSSCIYPRDCPQPIKEEYLLTGPLEPTNRPYALAKISGIEQCWAYNRQYGTQFLSVMPTNLYGPNDNYDLDNGHVLPALIRRLHEAKQSNSPTVTMWGTGSPKREFLYSDELADACVFLMNLPDLQFKLLLAQDRNAGLPPIINIGVGEDLSILELTNLVCEVVGYSGKIVNDTSKPDGTPRKLLDVGRLNALGWKANMSLRKGIEMAYEDFLKLHG